MYIPVCEYLKAQGYKVKSEVEHCDVVAMRADEPPLIVELKVRLNLELILQAADRLKISDSVYIAFPGSAALWKRHWKRVRNLCQRLGIGIITLDGKSLKVNSRLDPASYNPRGSKVRKHRLLAEFEHRVGDNNVGGTTRQPLMTAYRQDALRCLAVLVEGPRKLSDIRDLSGVGRASGIFQNDHYGWFERVKRGYYQLSPKGEAALKTYAKVLKELSADG